jgi:hypothetical protein
MSERFLADGKACFTCAARTLLANGEPSICQPSKLGQSNKKEGKHRRFVIVRRHTTGTTMRPKDCPHPESKVATTSSTQSLLYKIVKNRD